MDLPLETDEYIRESIENSLGLPVSVKTLRLKLLASEDERRRLQDRIFLLQDLLSGADRRLEQYRVWPPTPAILIRFSLFFDLLQLDFSANFFGEVICIIVSRFFYILIRRKQT